MKLRTFFLGCLVPLGLAAATNLSSNEPVKTVEIHYAARHFAPQKIEVPAGTSLTLRVVNDSHERIEFESFRLHREKIVEAGETLVLRFQPLKAGTYDFFDDFHEDVPEGQIVAR